MTKPAGNKYTHYLGAALVDAIPKHVAIAVAVSLASHRGTQLGNAPGRIAEEWQRLYDLEIVPQRPPARVRRDLPTGDEYQR